MQSSIITPSADPTPLPRPWASPRVEHYLMWPKVHRIHFVGIGGSGMSGIAEVLLNQGYLVTGSDLKCTPVTDRLETLGARIFEGHAATNLGPADVVVVSTAVRPDNPEIRAAISEGIPVIPRAEMLAELMRLKCGIAVAGAHGKTTTTSMIGTMLAHAGWDPTIVVGGRVSAMGSNARLGSGEILVAEADESDKSFLRLAPIYAVVTNIDREHLDYYRDLSEIHECFEQFLNKIPFYGCAVINRDDPYLSQMATGFQRRIRTYAVGVEAEFTASEINLPSHPVCGFTVLHQARELGRIELHVPGVHNISNALAAVALGTELGLGFGAIAAGLQQFHGVDRRFQLRAKINEILVVDDYGHHPTEIRVTLSAARRLGRRVLVLFQPHRYTRTQHLAEEFSSAFQDADRLWVTDIYPASEDPIPGITSRWLVSQIQQAGHADVRYAADLKKTANEIAREAEPGDLVMTLGAGNVYVAADLIESALARRRGPRHGK